MYLIIGIKGGDRHNALSSMNRTPQKKPVAIEYTVPTDSVDIFAIAVIRSRDENYRPSPSFHPARQVVDADSTYLFNAKCAKAATEILF